MGPETDRDAKLVTLAVTWGIAALVGVLACVMLFMFADIGSVTGTVVLAGLVAVVVGFALQFGMKDLPPLDSNVAKPAVPAASAPEPSAPTPAPSGINQPPVSADTGIRPSKALPGEAELASRKGSWKYEAEGTAAKPAEEAGEGTKPATLSKPKGGKADDLKKIKGVGPKLEQMLNEMGFYHFEQIAAWSADEVAWVDSNIEGFKGRVSRDDWVGQAKDLAG
jgi:NADH-quinone oxidoreductase subunit E